MYRLLIFAALTVLAACNRTHSPAYYRSHIDERDKLIDSCLGDGNENQECENAKAAYSVK